MYNKGGAGGSRGGMSWILAQTIIFQLSTLDSSLQARINHLSLIHSEVRAIISAKNDLQIEKDDLEKLNETGANIDSLRDSYEPFLDDPDAKNSADQKRKTSEKLIDISRYNLLYLTEKYKLVDMKTMQEINGIAWGD